MQLIDPGHMTLILRHGLCPECRHTINVISKVRPRPVIGGTVIGGTVRKSAVTKICAADMAGAFAPNSGPLGRRSALQP